MPRRLRGVEVLAVALSTDLAGFPDAQVALRPEDPARQLWEEHYPRLAGWCAAVVRDDGLAHDIAAEAFVRLLSRWRTVEQPRPFLYATAANLLRDHWRAAARQRSIEERLPVPSSYAAADNWISDLAGRLPDRLRGPVVLHYGADLPVEEVATALGRPVGSIKRQLAEGRDLLRVMLQGQVP